LASAALKYDSNRKRYATAPAGNFCWLKERDFPNRALQLHIDAAITSKNWKWVADCKRAINNFK